MTPLGQLPLRRALNLAYARLVAGRDKAYRDQIDEALARDPMSTSTPEPMDTRDTSNDDFDRQWAAFARQHGGEIG